MALMSAGAQAWAKGLETWGKMLGGVTASPPEAERKDRRFVAPEWSENPIFDTIRKTYLHISDQLLGTVDQIDGVDGEMREKLRFATRSFVDAMITAMWVGVALNLLAAVLALLSSRAELRAK